MKPYPAIATDSAFPSLIKRRESALLPNEPRDDSVPMELQEEDRPLPTTPAATLCLVGAYIVVGAAAFVALYFILR